MNTNFLKGAVASLFLGLGGVSAVLAESANGALGAPAGDMDIYKLECPDETHHVSARVTDLLPEAPPLVSLQIFKGERGKNTTDPIDGHGGCGLIVGQCPSPTVQLNKGKGKYFLLIDKTRVDAENYIVRADCFTIDDKKKDSVDGLVLIQNNQP